MCILYGVYHLRTVHYIDDSILVGPNEHELNDVIYDIKNLEKLNITEEEGGIQDFLGIHIDQKADGIIHLTQPHLIDQILKDLNMQDNTKEKLTPASSSKLL